MSELKNTLDRVNGSLDIAEGKISKFEGMTAETIQKIMDPDTLTRSGKDMEAPEEKTFQEGRQTELVS